MSPKIPLALVLATLLGVAGCSDSDDDDGGGAGGGGSPGDDGAIGEIAPLEGGTRPFADEVLYFMLPDRFANGDPANDCGFYTEDCPDDAGPETGLFEHGYLPSDKGYYHGGDIAGLVGKLDYLEGMGVTALWVGPIFRNKPVQDDISNLYERSSGYHGYWITDFMNVDPHFGTNAEFAEMVDAAHRRGIKVFMDIITNHTADVIKYADGDYAYVSKEETPYVDAAGQPFDDADFAWDGEGEDEFPELDLASFPHEPTVPEGEQGIKNPDWLNDPLLYHNRGDTSFTGENSVYGDFFGLDDLFTERREVVDGMIEIYRHWIETYKVDGFRIDTTKHVNVEFWQAFGPAIEAAATEAGIDHFFAFGEVYDEAYDPTFRSVFSTRGRLQSTIDFGFQAAARDFASRGGAASELAGFYALDDLYTDADSDAYSQPVFLGNHDMGRFGLFLVEDRPEADDAELLARNRLGHALMFFGRGQPVIYYGDEQGFTGDGGDKDAREDMFPSVVDVYNDNALIGSTASTAEDNFDPEHPLYATIAELSAVYSEHEALRAGVQIERHADEEAGVFAFSRILAGEDDPVEYLVALNNSAAEASAEVPTYSERASFERIYGDGAPSISAGDDGTVALSLPPFGVTVLRADGPLSWTNATAPEVTLELTGSAETEEANAQALYTGTQDGYDTFERLRVRAVPGTDQLHAVAFEASVDGGEFAALGTDRGKPYEVHYDASGLAGGETVVFRATLTTLDGQTSTVESEPQSIAVTSPELAGPRYDQAIIHYRRVDGVYEDASGCWGVHVWGDSVEAETDWEAPICMTGETDFGRFAVVDLASTVDPVNFIVHTPGGDTVGVDREPGGDRSFDASEHPEIWIVEGDETVHLANPELSTDTTRLRLHYRRPAGDYEGWGLHAFGDTTMPTDWNAPLMPVGSDDFGVIFDVPLADGAETLGYVLHKGDEKDPGPDQSVDLASSEYELWQVQGADPEAPHVPPVEDAGTAILHYSRPGGDYEGWGLHVWGDVAEATLANVTWETPLAPARTDAFGLVFEVPLTDDAESIGYIVHRGDEKDPEGDLGLDLAVDGYEVWQRQDASVERPFVLPVRPNF